MKIYYDAIQNKEVVDVSDNKTIAEINSEFSGNFSDVTKIRADKALADKLKSEEEAVKENLIQAKIRQQAIDALKIEGKLDNDGNINKEVI